jgi:hypothetical protein
MPIERRSFNTQKLMEEHPPVWGDLNKISVFNSSCPDGSKHQGQLEYSRWAAMELPAQVEPGRALRILLQREDVFDYIPLLDMGDAVEWHVNFADRHLFVAYGSGLFAQDEMQVAEHPALGALKEALHGMSSPALTEENGTATPILIRGIERRCRIATELDAAAGRPNGLYGNAFRRASEVAIRNAVTRIDPPSITNLIAIAAPSGGHGRYSAREIRQILGTAYTGFRAAALESSPRPTVIHTGFWGCGAFGGNRILMATLQLIAASMAQVDKLVFHTFNTLGTAALQTALGHIECMESSNTDAIITEIESLGLEWGQSDGN